MRKPIHRSKLFLVPLSLLLVYGTARFCHHQTAGFRISKIQDNTAPFPLPASPACAKEVLPLLNQKFTYFGRGLQSFAFLSEDGEHVLKICNNRYQRDLFWLEHFPLPSFLHAWRDQKVASYYSKLQATFSSYQLAYEKLKNETGLLALHLEKSQGLFPHVQIIDKLGIAHSIDLDKTAFILQKRATLVYTKLSQWRDQGNLPAAEKGITALLTLLHSKYAQGIGDKDPLIRTNFGFIEDLPVEIDVGPFYLDHRVQDPAFYTKEMVRVTTSLKHWIHDNYPALSPHLENELKKLQGDRK